MSSTPDPADRPADRHVEQLWPAPGDGPLTDPELAGMLAMDGPTLRANFVASADGAMEVGGLSRPLSGPADKRVMGILRMLSDAVLVGAGTLRQERYRPIRLDEHRREWRRQHGLADFPVLVTVSATLDLDPDLPALAAAPVTPLVLTVRSAPETRRAALRDVAQLVDLGDESVDPYAMVAELHRRGLTRLLCEGGPRLFGTLVDADLVDELCLTVAPTLAGPGASRIIGDFSANPGQIGAHAGVAGDGPETPRPMSLRHVLRAGSQLMLRYGRRTA